MYIFFLKTSKYVKSTYNNMRYLIKKGHIIKLKKPSEVNNIYRNTHGFYNKGIGNIRIDLESYKDYFEFGEEELISKITETIVHETLHKALDMCDKKLTRMQHESMVDKITLMININHEIRLSFDSFSSFERILRLMSTLRR